MCVNVCVWCVCVCVRVCVSVCECECVCVILAELFSINSKEPYEVAVSRFVLGTAAKHHVPAQSLKDAWPVPNSYTHC